MYQCLAITFRNGAGALVPVPEKDRTRLLDCIRDATEKSGFVEVSTIFEQPVWLNIARVSRIKFLLEDTNLLPIETRGVGPSKMYPEGEEDTDLDDIEFNVHIWTGAEKGPVEVCDITGHDWMEITTSCESKEQFFDVTDENGERLAVAISDVNMLIGTETARYSEALLETVYREIFGSNDVPPA